MSKKRRIITAACLMGSGFVLCFATALLCSIFSVSEAVRSLVSVIVLFPVGGLLFGGGWLFTTLIPHKRVKWVVRILLLIWFSLFFIVMSYVIPDIVIAL